MYTPAVSFGDAARVWARVALQSFGGPAGQIAVMHRVVVEERRWVSEHRFLHALNYCMLLPGPEAQQLATYLGWLMHGTAGGLVAGGLFVLPGFIALWGLSALYAVFGDVGPVAAAFFGLKAAVLAVVIEAVVRIGRRVLENGAMLALAAAAFVALFFFDVPFPVVVVGAGAIGAIGGQVRPDLFVVIKPPGAGEGGVVDALAERAGPPSVGATVRTAGTWLAIWLVPLAALAAALGRDHVLVEIGIFFSSVAVVTFGGAYAALAYVAQQAVEHHHWLSAGEMLDGLGLAETTPGPLIMVLEFVGFLAAWREPGAMHPLVAGTAGALVTTWVTFAPCFLWIFTGAPWVEALRGRRGLSAALSAITAAVVGVILNLGAWFGLHVLFGEVREVAGPLGARLLVPELSTVDPLATLIALCAAIAMLRYHVGMLPTLGAAAAFGLLAWGFGA